jgi:hypothetical protein
MKRPIELVTGLLEEISEPASNRVRGRYEGHDVEVRFVDRGSGSTHDPFTEVWMLRGATRTDVLLHVIPQTQADVAEIAHGRGTDVVVGDSAFDDAFFVEAGPTDVVVRLFDAPLREAMLAARPIAIHSHPDGLFLEQRGWIEDAAQLRRVVALGVRIVEALPLAVEAADRDAQSREGYRGTVSPEALADQRKREVSDVATKRSAREEHRRMTGCLLAGALMLVVMVWAALSVTFCGMQSFD